MAGRVKEQCAARGLLINTVGDGMLRLIPPMVLSAEEAAAAAQFTTRPAARI